MSNLASIISGPAQIDLDDGATVLGHTQGGITANITPEQRGRIVDQYGTSWCTVIHMGDEVRIQTPFAEIDANHIKAVYNPGRDQTGSSPSYLGIGRDAGYEYTLRKMSVIPLASANTNKRLIFWKTCPIGQFTQMFNHEDDRLMDVEHAAIIDESKTDGERIGRFQLSA